MAVRVSEADRLRSCRMRFERALRDGVSMAEADKRIALERIAERGRRIEQLRHAPIASRAEPQRPTLWYQDPDR